MDFVGARHRRSLVARRKTSHRRWCSAASLEVKDVDKDGGATFQVTINNVDARDKVGAKTTGAEFKGDLQGLNGMTINGNVD